ncbi:hypothetical protein N9L06_04830, partial [Mariniblastus sp.]|nr:hypothetical protein [Mariniblastus sp.]
MRFKQPGFRFLLTVVASMLVSVPTQAIGQEGSASKEGSAAKSGAAVMGKPAAKPTEVKLADDKLSLTAPGTWESVKPRSRILEAELKVPATEEGVKDGRITMMRAGGSIPEN